MSTDNLQTSAAFLELLLTGAKAQRRALLKTATEEQTNVLLEILYNLYILPHDKQDVTFFKKKKRFLSQFDLKYPPRRRKAVLMRKQATVLTVLDYFKSKLLNLL